MAGEHVWVVDDERTIRMMMQFFLEGKDYVPTCYEDAESALEALKSGDVPKPKAMLVDIVLPGMMGPELITAARPYLSNGDNCAFYFVTGKEGSVPKDDPNFADVAVYIKPMKMDELAKDLEGAVRNPGKNP